MQLFIHKHKNVLLIVGLLLFSGIGFLVGKSVTTKTVLVNSSDRNIIARAQKGAVFNKLTCQGINNESETYQFDCLAPHKTRFMMKNDLTCYILTNHQMSDTRDKGVDGKYLGLTTIKADYRKIHLKIDFAKKSILRDPEPGEYLVPQHTIIADDKHSITSIGKISMKESNIAQNIPAPGIHDAIPTIDTSYESITLLKNIGWGMISGYYIGSQDDINRGMRVEYFQCE